VDCRGQWGFVFIALQIQALPVLKFAVSAGGVLSTVVFGSGGQIKVLHGNIIQLT
jgi:hypothetical protein